MKDHIECFDGRGPNPIAGSCAASGIQGGCRSEGRRKIVQCIEYMTQRLDQPLQVAHLAARVHVSSSHFFVLFKRWAGMSPIDYFIRLRMTEAGRLLENTGMSVKEIAAKLGYEDPFYFSRMFKAVHGVAPSGYRARLAQAKSLPFLEGPTTLGQDAGPDNIIQLAAKPEPRTGSLARQTANGERI